jgi:deoxyribodipyrimidine photo-lyase
MENKKIGIFIFRRDLRLDDNLALNKLANEVDIIIPVFILDKNQIKRTKANINYFSISVVQFMAESLTDLNYYLTKNNSKLRLFYGNFEKIIKKLIKWTKLFSNNVYLAFNLDFSSYALSRDQKIQQICIRHNINIITSEDDLTLVKSEYLIKSDGTGFKQYGAFLKHVQKYKVNVPCKPKHKIFLSGNISIISEYDINRLDAFYETNYNLAQNGGRKKAIKILKNSEKFNTYETNRNMLYYSTTNLSAYLNFGCISIRETYYMLYQHLKSKAEPIIKQLYWRDFFLQAVRFLPSGNAYHHMVSAYDKIKWDKNPHNNWNKLINSQTGFLIIDAAMNEMKQTGFMHNRARMMVGIFWTKYLQINIFDKKYGSQVGFSN